MNRTSAINEQPTRRQLAENSLSAKAEFARTGALSRLEIDDLSMLLYPASDLEDGLSGLWLRFIDGDSITPVSLIGISSGSTVEWTDSGPLLHGQHCSVSWTVAFRFASDHQGWFWHIRMDNLGSDPIQIDLLHTHDVALAPWSAVRNNEFYVSQYLDLTPIDLPGHGLGLGVRQNMPGKSVPWAMIGCLGTAIGWATDALQLTGRGRLDGEALPGLNAHLPSSRLQHEHTLAALQTAPITLAPGQRHDSGFFGLVVGDHPEATGPADAALASALLSDPSALSPITEGASSGSQPPTSLFATARVLTGLPHTDADLALITDQPLISKETAEDGTLLAAFTSDGRHLVTTAKQREVLRPHGHLMRTGNALVPDERTVTTTTWMAGTFHSHVSQGHVGFGSMLSLRRTYLGLQQGHGLRIFISGNGHDWQLLGTPSLWVIGLDHCRWLYRYPDGLIEVVSSAPSDDHRIGVQLRVLEGPPCRLLAASEWVFAGAEGQPMVTPDGSGAWVAPPADSPSADLYPHGRVRLDWSGQATLARDEPLFADTKTADLPWLTVQTEAVTEWQLRITPTLVSGFDAEIDLPEVPPKQELWDWVQDALTLQPPESADGTELSKIAQILPWFAHDALIHYLSPRGLEQYSGGGWGTRDASQGPVGLLIALGAHAELREVVLRLLAAQNVRGDWPQAFDFYPRHLNGGQADSHGDVIYWPLLAVGEYLAATGDYALLAEKVPMIGDDGPTKPVRVLDHLARALEVIQASRIPGTVLPAYGHGDWNDSLQPADADLAARLCSSWTVILQSHALMTLSRALLTLTEASDHFGLGNTVVEKASKISVTAAHIALDGSFALQEKLIEPSGLIAGYGLFGSDKIELLIHPGDQRTGLRYSVLPMIHAISADQLDADQAARHLDAIHDHLLGPDGARLFDQPVRYAGGPMELFQRAEASTFFGREIGIMYMHAHLRYAEALARVGDADGLLAALARANPIGITERVPSARRRQSTTYYSSSDAAFSDRYDASARYSEIASGEVALEGGWRVYSSGPGLFLRLVVENLLGVRCRNGQVEFDPVLTIGLDGLSATIRLFDQPVRLRFRVSGPGRETTRVSLAGVPLESRPVFNPYREGGVSVEAGELQRILAAQGFAEEILVEVS